MALNIAIMEQWEPYFANPNPKTKQNFIRMVIVGPSDSGKSYMFKYLYHTVFKKQYETFIVFCGSKDTLKEYRECIGTDLCFATYNPEIIEVLQRKQEKLESEGRPQIKVMVIYDDYATRKNKGEESVFDLAISGRHESISFCMILHDLVLADRVVRDQCTHLIMTRQTSFDVYEKIVNQYLLMTAYSDDEMRKEFGSKRQLRDYLVGLLMENTYDHNTIIVLLSQYKQQKTKIQLLDVIKRFKAGDLPRIRD